jgi:hypothetical protein
VRWSWAIGIVCIRACAIGTREQISLPGAEGTRDRGSRAAIARGGDIENPMQIVLYGQSTQALYLCHECGTCNICVGRGKERLPFVLPFRHILVFRRRIVLTKQCKTSYDTLL